MLSAEFRPSYASCRGLPIDKELGTLHVVHTLYNMYLVRHRFQLRATIRSGSLGIEFTNPGVSADTLHRMPWRNRRSPMNRRVCVDSGPATWNESRAEISGPSTSRNGHPMPSLDSTSAAILPSQQVPAQPPREKLVSTGSI